MSRSKLIRVLAAAASLLGAVPLMGQTVASANAPAFPYGNYTMVVPPDDNHATARTLQFTLREGAMQVFEDGQLIQSYMTTVAGRDWKLTRLGGPCSEVGDYTWSLQGDVLTFTVVTDGCPGRAEKMARTRLVRATAPAAAPAQVATSSPMPAGPGFPYGTYALVTVDSLHGPPPGLSVQFTTDKLIVMQGGQVLETYSASVSGDTWEVFELGNNECTEAGDYHWKVEGNVMSLIRVTDPCEQRATQIQAVKFQRM